MLQHLLNLLLQVPPLAALQPQVTPTATRLSQQQHGPSPAPHPVTPSLHGTAGQKTTARCLLLLLLTLLLAVVLRRLRG
jgi:hypothetical protein